MGKEGAREGERGGVKREVGGGGGSCLCFLFYTKREEV